jgi:hypothetical protein
VDPGYINSISRRRCSQHFGWLHTEVGLGTEQGMGPRIFLVRAIGLFVIVTFDQPNAAGRCCIKFTLKKIRGSDQTPWAIFIGQSHYGTVP